MSQVLLSFLLAFVLVQSTPAQEQPDAASLVKEGQALLQDGKIETAIEKFRAAVAADSQRADAHDALGKALDIEGRYAEAREHLERALELSPEESKVGALTALGTSYAFESRAEDAARYYRRVFDAQMAAKEPTQAAATANALGRVYLESGNTVKAEQWYRTGYETSRRLPHTPASQLAVWDMRWQHALGRIAARKGRRAVALKHAAAVKRLLDKGGIDENQRAFYPYLLGYIDFHTHRYRQAIATLQTGDQTDVFVLGMIGQSYRQLKDDAHAREYFERVMAGTNHNINTAFARPIARAYLKRPQP